MPPRSRDLISPVNNRQANNAPYSKSKHLDTLTSTSGIAPPAYSTSRISFATVSLHMSDRIRFLQFPDHDLPRIVEIVATSWSDGIQGTRQYAGSFEIKLKGYPWAHNAPGTVPGDNQPRRLIRRLLEGLYNLGWLFDTSVRTCKKPSEKDTMIFMKRDNLPILVPCEWLAISCDHPNILNVQCGPSDLTEALRGKLEKWITKTSVDDSCTRFTLKTPFPWSPHGKDTMGTRSILLVIRETLEIFQFGIYASLTMMSGEGKGETDVLFCNRRLNGN